MAIKQKPIKVEYVKQMARRDLIYLRCRRCLRYGEVRPAALMATHGDRAIASLRFRCLDCDSDQVQVWYGWSPNGPVCRYPSRIEKGPGPESGARGGVGKRSA